MLTSTLLLQVGGQEELLGELTENWTTLTEGFEAIDQAGYLAHVEDGMVEELEQLLQQYYTAQTQVVELVTAGEYTQALQLFIGELLPEGQQVDDLMVELIDAHSSQGQEMLNRLGAGTRTDMWVLGGFMAAAAVCCLVITFKMSNSISKSVDGLFSGMEGLRNGQLSTRVAVLSQDDFGKIAQWFNESCETLDRYVSHVNTAMEEIAAGRLVYDDTLTFQGDFHTMQQAIRHMVDQENQLIQVVQSTAQQVTDASGQVSAAAQGLAQGATQQASSVEELSAAVAELSQRMKSAVQDAASTSASAEQAGELAMRTNEKMKRMLESMEQIDTASERVGDIVKSIGDIAFQTNLLALNAAVEAARAGTAGKGFAVVADAVRNLAVKCSQEAAETAQLVQSTLKAVAQGRELAGEAAQLIHSTTDASAQSVKLTGQVLELLDGQSTALAQISLGLEQISAVVQNNSATSQQSAAAAQELYAQAEQLAHHVQSFTLS